jgi:quercetin dioxygenase-like cupin family protein
MSAKARSWLFAATGGMLVCGVTAILSWPGAALATPPKDFTSEFTRSFFERIRVLGGTDREGEDARVKIIAKDPSDVYIASNTVAPGGYSGWHTHPGPSVVLVKSGTATVYDGDDPNCMPVRYPAGTGFIDAGGGHVHMVRNEGTDPLVTVAFQIIPMGAPRRIDAASPGYCPF